jgi:hypothetical protein
MIIRPKDWLGNDILGIEIEVADDALQSEIDFLLKPYAVPPETPFDIIARISNLRSVKIKDMILKLFAQRTAQGYSLAQQLLIYRAFQEPISLSLIGTVELALESLNQLEAAAQNYSEPQKTVTLNLIRDFRAGLDEARI